MVPSVLCLVVLSVVLGCQAAPRTTVYSNDIPDVQVRDDGVSASVGGYHASAGLGGTLDGGPAGGLHAEAGTPDGTGASAGLGGAVGGGGGVYSQAGAAPPDAVPTGTHYRPRRPVVKRPPDFYDNVFNIPISVLEAVNQLLGGGPPKTSVGVAGGSTNIQARTGASAESASGSTASTATKTQAGFSAGGSTTGTDPKAGFFDSIFNIPISALKSVNQLLNAKNEQRPPQPHPHPA